MKSIILIGLVYLFCFVYLVSAAPPTATFLIQPTQPVGDNVTACVYSEQYANTVCPDILSATEFYTQHNASRVFILEYLFMDGVFNSPFNGTVGISFPTTLKALNVYAFNNSNANVVFSGTLGPMIVPSFANTSLNSITFNNLQFSNINDPSFVVLNVQSTQTIKTKFNNCTFSYITTGMKPIIQVMSTYSNDATNFGSLTLTNCTMSNNTRAGLVIAHNVVFTFVNSLIFNNTQVSTLMSIVNGAMYVNQTTISNNFVVFGPLTMVGSNLFVANSTLTGNTGTSGSCGGVFSLLQSAIFTLPYLQVTNSTFSHNTAPNGGAIYISNENANADTPNLITSSIFDNNVANSVGAGAGGAIYGQSIYLTIILSSFDANSAIYNGGAVSIDQSFLLVQNSSFTNNLSNNSTSSSGGVFYLTNSNVQAQYTIIQNNTASNGNLLSCRNSEIVLYHCQFDYGKDVDCESSCSVSGSNWDDNEHCPAIPSSSSADVKEKKDKRDYIIIGCVIGGVVFLVIVILIIVYIKKRHHHYHHGHHHHHSGHHHHHHHGGHHHHHHHEESSPLIR